MDFGNIGSLFGDDDGPKQNNKPRKNKRKNKKNNKKNQNNRKKDKNRLNNQKELKAGLSRKFKKNKAKALKRKNKHLNKALRVIDFSKFILNLSFKDPQSQKEQKYNVNELLEMIKNMEDIETAERLIPEDDYGNTEYKLKLVDHSNERVQHLTSQMKFRLEEGLGEALYNLGYEDDGNPLGLDHEELSMSLKTLSFMAQKLRAEFCIMKFWKGKKGLTAQAVVRKHQRDGFKPEIRICLLGDFASGKSTLLGVLTSGNLDNGDGLARLSILNHKHEVLTGITSSLTYAMIGFDNEGNVIKDNGFGTSFERIFDQSTKILSFFDTGGHQKYSRSLLQSFMTNCPDYGMIVVNPLQSLDQGFVDTFQIVTALQIPSFIVITHSDLIDDETLANTLDEIRKVKRTVNNKLHMLLVRSSEDVVFFGKNIKEDLLPVFAVSNVTGLNISALKKFLNVLPVSIQQLPIPLENDDPDLISQTKNSSEFLINNKFFKDDLIIVTGGVIRGKVAKRQNMWLGPDSKGKFKPVEITSIHCYKVPVRMASCGQTCSVAIRERKGDKKWLKMFNIKKGMILVEAINPPRSSTGFIVEFKLFDESEDHLELPPFYEPVVTSRTFKQTCYILSDHNSPQNTHKMEIHQRNARNNENKATGNLSQPRSKSKDLVRHKSTKSAKSDSEREIKRLRKRSQLDINIKIKRSSVYLKKGHPVVIAMRFKYNPEFLVKGQRVIIHDQKTKAIGVIKELIH